MQTWKEKFGIHLSVSAEMSTSAELAARVAQLERQLMVHETMPLAKLLVMGTLADGLLVLHAGARGYLYKGDNLCDILVSAIETVMLDRPYLSPIANAEYLISMQSPNANERLDPESRQVLQLLAHGEHAGQISEHMGIDKRRVYWVREKLHRRFGAKTNEHLIQRASAEGFIYPRE